MTNNNKDTQVAKDRIYNEVLSLYNINKDSNSIENGISSVYLNDITGGQIKLHTQYINNNNSDDIVTFFEDKVILEYSSFLTDKNIRIYKIRGELSILDINNQPFSKSFEMEVEKFDELHAIFESKLLNFYKDLLNTYILSPDKQIDLDFNISYNDTKKI